MYSFLLCTLYILTFHILVFFLYNQYLSFQTTYTTAFLLYHLAKNPDVQENLYKESLILLPKVNSPVTEEVLQEAQYAKAVLKESLRLRPISVGIGRVLQNDAEFSGYLVPQGVRVYYNFYFFKSSSL